MCSSRLAIVHIMKRLLIVGAGGLGREVVNWAVDEIKNLVVGLSPDSLTITPMLFMERGHRSR